MTENPITLERFTQNKYSVALTFTMIFILLIPLTLWLMWTMGQADPRQGVILTYYFVFLLIYAIVFLADTIMDYMKLKPDTRIINIAGIGSKPALISIAAIAFLWVGYAMTASNLGVSLPQSLGQEQLAFLDMIYKVVLSPFLEELAIRGALMLIVTGIILRFTNKSRLIALTTGILLQATFFAVLHWLAYQGEIGLILTSAIWGTLAGMIVWLTGSILPAITFHIGNNATIYFTTTGQGHLVLPILIGVTGLIVMANILIINQKGVKWWINTANPTL